MRLIITTLLLVSFFAVNAQSPVIDRSNYFEVGDSAFIYTKYDTSLFSLSPGASGANVQWDFSGVDFNHPSVIIDTLFYISPIGTPFFPGSLSADYSQSNLCFLKKTDPFSFENSDYNYYKLTDDSLSFIGHWANNGGSELWEDHCTDFISELRFPFSYPGSYVDTFNRFFFDMSGSDAHYTTGTISVAADGYGSMITPDGLTLHNVLRIHTVTTARDSNALFGITTTTRHTYRWYSPDKKGFILSLNMGLDGTTVETAEYQKQFDFNTSVTAGRQENEMLVYPNPANGRFRITALQSGNVKSVEILNGSGQLIRSENNAVSGNSMDMDLSNLAKGIYLLKISDGVSFISRKVIIQ